MKTGERKKKRGFFFRVLKFFLTNLVVLALLVGLFGGYQKATAYLDAKSERDLMHEYLQDLPGGYFIELDGEILQSLDEQAKQYDGLLDETIHYSVPFQQHHNGLIFEKAAGPFVDIEAVRSSAFADYAVLGSPIKVRGAKGEVSIDASHLLSGNSHGVVVYGLQGDKVVKLRGQKFDQETGRVTFTLDSNKIDLIALTRGTSDLDEYRHLAVNDPDEGTRQLDLFLKVEWGGGSLTEVREMIDDFEKGGLVVTTISPLRVRMLDFVFNNLLAEGSSIFDLPGFSSVVDTVMLELGSDFDDYNGESRERLAQQFTENVGYRKTFAEAGKLPDAWLDFPLTLGDAGAETVDENAELLKIGPEPEAIGRTWDSGFSVFRDGFSFPNMGPAQNTRGICMGFAVVAEVIYNEKVGQRLLRQDVLPAQAFKRDNYQYIYDMTGSRFDNIFASQVTSYRLADPVARSMGDGNPETNPQPVPMAEDTGPQDGPLITALAGYWDVGNIEFFNMLDRGNFYEEFNDIERLQELFCKGQVVTVGMVDVSESGAGGHAIVGYRLDQSAVDPDVYWLHVYENNNPINRLIKDGKEVDASHLLRIRIRKKLDPELSQFAGNPCYTYAFDYLIFTESKEELLKNPWASSSTGGNLNFMYNFGALREAIPLPDPCPGTVPQEMPGVPDIVPEPAGPEIKDELAVPTQAGVGSWIKLGSYHGQPLLWRVIHTEGGRALLFSDRILSLKAFDAFGDAPGGRDHVFRHRVLYGSNYWAQANLREWLNSEDNVVSFSTQPPTAAHVAWGLDSYADEPGFLANWTAAERQAIVPSTHKTLLSWFDRTLTEGPRMDADMLNAVAAGRIMEYNEDVRQAADGYEQAFYQNVTDRVFLLSVKELHDYVYQQGMDIRGYLTQEAVNNSQILKDGHSINEPWQYWLRTPLQGAAAKLRYVDSHGKVVQTDAYGAVPGVRPAVYVSLDQLAGVGSKEEPLTLQ